MKLLAELQKQVGMLDVLRRAWFTSFNTDIEFVPDHGIVLSGAEEVALMEAERIRGGRFTH